MTDPPPSGPDLAKQGGVSQGPDFGHFWTPILAVFPCKIAI